MYGTAVPVTLPDPSKLVDVHTTSPVIPIVRPVANAVVVLSITCATTPSMFATSVPVVIDKLPVESVVAVVVPTVNLSALSSHAMIALSPVEPLSIKILHHWH